jgi:hypothetical protein
MSNPVSEESTLDALLQAEQRGAFLRVLGGCMLLMACLTSVWIWVGWRAGTWFWFWWTSGLGVIGMSLWAGGALLQQRAAREYAALSGTLRARLASPLKAEGGVSPADSQRRAA